MHLILGYSLLVARCGKEEPAAFQMFQEFQVVNCLGTVEILAWEQGNLCFDVFQRQRQFLILVDLYCIV